MPNKIIFNGNEYASVDEMPPDVRQAYEQAMSTFTDANRNGVPDIFEHGGLTISKRVSQIVYNGKAYSSVNELPAEARQQYEEAMAKLDANRNGIPDVLDSSKTLTFKTTKRVQLSSPSVQPSRGQATSNTVLIMAVAIIFLLALVGALFVMLVLK